MNILICGVGGQGIILSSDILAEVAMISGYDVKKSEIHGMAQRGGAVTSSVKFGKKVYSPIICQNEADIILAFEKIEALRNINYLKQNGIYIINDYELPPLSVIIGEDKMEENIEDKIKSKANETIIVDAISIAKSLADVRVVNVVLLGVISKKLQFTDDAWFKSIEHCVKEKYWEINKKAFIAGKKWNS